MCRFAAVLALDFWNIVYPGPVPAELLCYAEYPATHAAMVTCSLLAVLPEPADSSNGSSSSAWSALAAAADPVCCTGIAGMGVALTLIHIYIAPLKRMLQVSSTKASSSRQ